MEGGLVLEGEAGEGGGEGWGLKGGKKEEGKRGKVIDPDGCSMYCVGR